MHRIAVAERIPRILDGILREADIHARREKLLYAREPAPLRIAVLPPLKRDVLRRARDEMQPRAPQIRHHAERVRAVGRAERARMARRRARADAFHRHERREELEVARLIIVRLIAVHIDAAVVFHRELHRAVQRPLAELARELVVRDRADAVRAEPQRLLHERLAARIRVEPVLRERDHLDRHEIPHLLAQREQRLKRHEPRRRHIDMRADILHAREHLRADGRERPRADRRLRIRRLHLRPAPDPLEERPRAVPPARVDRVEMDVRLHIRRDHELPAEIHALRLRLDLRRDRLELPIRDEQVVAPLFPHEMCILIKRPHRSHPFSCRAGKDHAREPHWASPL